MSEFAVTIPFRSSPQKARTEALSNRSNYQTVDNSQDGKLASEDHSIEKVRVDLAASFSQLCDSFRLVHDRYVDSGYMEPHSSGMRYSIFHFLPQTKIFVATKCKRVVGTGYIVLDSGAGLPSSHIFHREFAQLRDQGRAIAEAGSFACDPVLDGKHGMVNLRLIKTGFPWAAGIGVDDLCVVVNPKHVSFYTRVLGFEQLCDARSCSYVRGADGLLLRLDLSSILQGISEPPALLRKELFHIPELGSQYQLSKSEVRSLIAQQPDTYLHASPSQRKMLRQLYPKQTNWSEKDMGIWEGADMAGAY